MKTAKISPLWMVVLSVFAVSVSAGCNGSPAASATRSAATGADLPPVYHATLDNGVRVVLAPDDNVPSVALKLASRVTTRDESPGLEGMRFPAGTSIFWSDEYVKRTEQVGGWWDPTNLYNDALAQDIVVPAKDIDTGIAVFRDMLVSTDPEHPHIDWFLENRYEKTGRYRGIARSFGTLDQLAFEDSFLKGRDNWGKTEMTPELLRDFRAKYMVPALMQVSIVGAFDPVETLEKLKTELGTVPNPPSAVRDTHEFTRYLPGFRTAVRGEGPVPADYPFDLLVAFPIPEDVTFLVSRWIGSELRGRLQRRFGEENAIVDVDQRPGQRLFAVALKGDPVTLYRGVQEELALFPESFDEETVRKGAEQVRRRQAARRMGNYYWMTWPVSYPTRPMGWRWGSPWERLEEMKTFTAQDARETARRILNPALRFVAAVADNPEEAKTFRGKLASVAKPVGSARFRPERADFPGNLPPSSGKPPAGLTSLLNPNVQTLAGGRVLFLTSKVKPWYTLEGTYPLGVLEEKTRGYAEALQEAVPEEWKERKFRFSTGPDGLSFSWGTAVWTPEELTELLREVADWLGTPPVEPAQEVSVPALAHVLEGEAPRWTLMVCGPERFAVPLEVERMEGPAVPSPSVRWNVEGVEPPAEAPFAVVMEIPASGEPANGAILRALSRWFDQDSRTEKRYGPFTLLLPELKHPPSAVDGMRVGDQMHLVLSYREGVPEEVLAWIRGGEAIAPAVEKEAWWKLDGQVRTQLRRYSIAPQNALWVHIEGMQNGGDDPAWLDRVEEQVRALEPERFLSTARSWLKTARIVPANLPAPETEENTQ